MTEWQDISTAPRDGTEILGWRDDCGILLVRWDCPENFLTDQELEELDAESSLSEDWFAADFVCGERLDDDLTPTKWHPLPKPPNE